MKIIYLCKLTTALSLNLSPCQPNSFTSWDHYEYSLTWQVLLVGRLGMVENSVSQFCPLQSFLWCDDHWSLNHHRVKKVGESLASKDVSSHSTISNNVSFGYLIILLTGFISMFSPPLLGWVNEVQIWENVISSIKFGFQIKELHIVKNLNIKLHYYVVEKIQSWSNLFL